MLSLSLRRGIVVTMCLLIIHAFSFINNNTLKLVNGTGASLDLIAKSDAKNVSLGNNSAIKLVNGTGVPLDLIAKSDVIGFWHIGSSNTIKRDLGLFVQKQWNELHALPFFKDENITWTMYAITEEKVSKETWEKLAAESSGRIQYIRPDIISPSVEQPYYEFPTLDMLHKFCAKDQNMEKSVFYIHSKTSDKSRQEMQNHLFQKCHKCLLGNPSKQVCGPRWRGGGNWCHFSGNFWFTRCQHIRKLRAPFSEAICKEGWDTGLQHGGWPHDIRPYGRFFAEYWVANDWKDQKRKEHHNKPFVRGGPENPCHIPESDRC